MIAEGGEMVEPLRDPAFFARVFLDVGILTWPNGFDLEFDRTAHGDRRKRGLLRRSGGLAEVIADEAAHHGSHRQLQGHLKARIEADPEFRRPCSRKPCRP